jgi:hypothetical protein
MPPREEPTRERFEAYEKALKCHKCYHPGGLLCHRHDPNGRRTEGDLGCPVAVAAARVEAEELGRLTADPP